MLHDIRQINNSENFFSLHDPLCSAQGFCVLPRVFPDSYQVGQSDYIGKVAELSELLVSHLALLESKPQ